MAGAALETLLADGPTNTTWLVTHAGGRWVLRLDKPAAVALGLDRTAERAVCEATAAAGIGPAYTHFDAPGGVCLRPYIDGAILAPDDMRDRRTLAELAAVLRRLHALPPVGRSFDPLAAAQRYAAEVGTAEAGDLARRGAAVLDSAPRTDAITGLCHNDLVAANIVRTPRGLLLIDWEYAGIGDPWFDLAVVVGHHGLGDDLAAHLLGAYLERMPGAAERAALQRQCDFYGLLLELWNLRLGSNSFGK